MADVEEKENFIASATHKKPKQSASLVTDVLLKSARLEKEDINSCVKNTYTIDFYYVSSIIVFFVCIFM